MGGEREKPISRSWGELKKRERVRKRGKYTYTTYTILPMTITVPASLHHVRLHSISATVANVAPRARTQARPGGQKQGSLSIGGMVFGGGFPASS